MKRILSLFLVLLCFASLFSCDNTEIPNADGPNGHEGENQEQNKNPSEKCDHEYSAWKIITYPTKDAWGENRRTCSKCQTVETMAIPYGSYSAGLEYVSNGDGTCSVKGVGYCEDTNVVIPPYNAQGEPVTNIREYAFYGCPDITDVVLPETLISIAPGAFYGCSGLVSMVIPDKVTFIGNSAFFRCSRLTTLVLPKSMEIIGYNCIGECYRLRSVLYAGSQEEWEKMTIHTGNEILLRNNVLTYNYTDNYTENEE